jgi:hypothetical protein
MSKKKIENLQDGIELNEESKKESNQAQALLTELATALEMIKDAADKCTLLGHMNMQFQKSIDKASVKPFPEGVKSLLKLMTVTIPKVKKNSKIKVDAQYLAPINADESVHENMSRDDSPGSTESITSINDARDDTNNAAISPHCNIHYSGAEPSTPILHNHNKAPYKNANSLPNKVNITTVSPSVAATYIEAVCEQMQALSSIAMRLPACSFRYGLATAMNQK